MQRERERVTRFTQFHVLGLSFPHLIYISIDYSSLLLLQLKSSLSLKYGGKKYIMGTAIVMSVWPVSVIGINR